MDDPTPTWDSFVARLVDQYVPRTNADRVLWRVTKLNREIICREREPHTTAGYVGLSCAEHNGQVDLTEVHKSVSRSTG